MAFNDVDLYLSDKLMETINELRGDDIYVLEDAFSGRPERELAALREYLGKLVLTDDVDHRKKDGEHVLYVLLSFPLADLPAPQICITLPTEQANDFPLGAGVQDTEEATDGDGNVTGYVIRKGYFAQGQWNVDILAASKLEAIWLARMVQLTILRCLDDMDLNGVKNVSFNTVDLEIAQQQLPQLMFARRIQISGVVIQEWIEHQSNGIYAEGVNLALES